VAKTAGRPSSYTPEAATEICSRIAEGETVRQIAADDHMPAQGTIFRWLNEHEAFQEQYARARERQLDRWEDEIVEIADDSTNDWMTRESASGRIDEVANHDHIARSRLRVDARKWIMSKRLPRKYGERLGVEGADGGPVQVVVRRFSEEEGK